MKRKLMIWSAMQICMAVAIMSVFYSCTNGTVVEKPKIPTEDVISAGVDGNIEFDIANENSDNPNEANGTDYADPVFVEGKDSVNVTVSQKSSYKDPDSSIYTCKPKATIKLKVLLDTVYAKDIKALKKVVGQPKVSVDNTGTNSVEYTTEQVFNVGGQSVSFNLGYEVYTHKNSNNQTIEMPYIKVNEAKFGASAPTEEEIKARGGNVRLADISVVPVKKALSRSITHADSTTYEVTAKFNLDIESKNTSDDKKQTLSFEVKYYGVVVDIIDYEWASLTYDITSTIKPQNALYVVKNPQVPLEIFVKQNSSYQGLEAEMEAGCATTKISVVAPSDVYFANKKAINAGEVSALTAITVEEETLIEPLPYFDFSEAKFEGFKIASSNVCDTLETHHVIAKYSQEAIPVNVETATKKPEKLTFVYQVEFDAKVKI